MGMPGSGLVSMLDSDRVGDLKRMYTLFNKVPKDVGKDSLRSKLRQSVETRGRAINDSAANSTPGQDDEDDKAEDKPDKPDPKGKGKAKAPSAAATTLSQALRWVQDVLDLKDKFDRILDEAFGGDKQVQASINEVRLDGDDD